MNGETYMWFLVYAVTGLIVLAIVAAIVGSCFKTVRQTERYHVQLVIEDLPGYQETITADLADSGEVQEFISRFQPRADDAEAREFPRNKR